MIDNVYKNLRHVNQHKKYQAYDNKKYILDCCYQRMKVKVTVQMTVHLIFYLSLEKKVC